MATSDATREKPLCCTIRAVFCRYGREEIMQQPPNPYDQTRRYAPPPPPRRPNALNRFLTWYKRQTGVVKIIVALAFLAVVIFVGSAAVAGITQGSQPIATPTTQGATSAPTQVPTATPVLTATQRI